MANLVVHRFADIADRDAWQPRRIRHRIRRDARGEIVPIVYRLDPAMPDAVRDAVVEGGNWWADAFAAAGLPGAFRVEPLPAGADLLDPRQNVVFWTHRADRGWSYGPSQIDPRTGEIVRGVVRLGSQRVEQVRAITESVLAPYGADDRSAEVREVVLARLRQLAAHEIGHTLGLAHNFASHAHDVPSVMDYPAPVFSLVDGRVEAAGAYAVGLGPWDLRQIRALYAPDDHAAEDLAPGLAFSTDADARLDEAADASGATWIQPRDAERALASTLAVRAAALAAFSPAVVPPGSDGNELERRFTVLHLLHRYQAVAVAKLVGGSRRRYAHTAGERFDGASTPVDVDTQRAALAALVRLVEPDVVDVPAHVRPLLVPTAGGIPRRDGSFAARTSGVFDDAAATVAAVDLIAALLLAPERLDRVHAQTLAGSGIGIDAVLHALVVPAVRRLDAGDAGRAAADWAVLRRMTVTAAAPALHAHVRAATADLLGAEPEPQRRSVAAAWSRLLTALTDTVDELPALPLGTPI